MKVNKQLGGCQANQGRLEQDLENKDVALDIDHTCHNIHNNSKDIQLHGGIERQVMKYSIQNIKRQKKIDNLQVKGAEPTAWERKSDKNLQDSQKARAKSERLRAEVEHCRQLLSIITILTPHHHQHHHRHHLHQVEHHLASAANAMLESWNSTNQAFTTR